MGQVRILARREELKLVEDQRGNPVGIVPINSPRELDEWLEVPSVPQFDTTYRDGDRTRHACPPPDENMILSKKVSQLEHVKSV
jgi:hypothetical protein